MRRIDIDSLDEAALVELNTRIVARLQFLHAQRTAAALQDIRVGSGVTFEGHDGTMIRGIVIRRNKKTVTVHTDDERQWNVSPTLLTLTGRHVLDTLDGALANKAGNVVALPKVDRR